MIVTHKMKMDLVDKPGRSILDVTQGDSIRVLELELLEQDAAWQIPANVHVIIRYDKSDGTSGCYDTLPDGTQAWESSGNKLRIALAPALCSTKGFVDMQIALIRGSEQISTFVIGLDVDTEVAGGGEPEDYINLSKWLSIFAQKGVQGKSAYEIAVEYGFAGTEEEWVESLVGKDGETPEIERSESAPYTLIKMGGEIVAAIYDGYTPEKGLDYNDGVTPHIGENGNWWIAETDTGVRAEGTDGETPVIFRPAGSSMTLIQMGGEVVAAVHDGYTPLKGLDYWTEDDKAEMVADVIAALPVYNGEVV